MRSCQNRYVVGYESYCLVMQDLIHRTCLEDIATILATVVGERRRSESSCRILQGLAAVEYGMMAGHRRKVLSIFSWFVILPEPLVLCGMYGAGAGRAGNSYAAWLYHALI